MSEVIFFQGKQSLGNFKAKLLVWSPVILFTLLLVVPPLVIVAYLYLSAVTTKYKVTNSKLLLESGIFSRKINALDLWRINDVQLRQNFLEMILGEGKLLLVTQDASSPLLVIEGIPLSVIREIFEKIQPAIAQSRKENRAIGITA